ncbi:MAG: NAD(P)-dependent alcohol dehydrogenase [Anaerolineaceae bacterium]|nr:NAD(P)-dependent alcohol dehydrogenase [Anaerolineaceae bacterium]
MKAITYTEYGSPDVLHVTEIEKPTPNDNEVLIKIQAVPVNFGDTLARDFKSVSMREFNMPSFLWLIARASMGFSKPKNPILGSEFAGEIEAVGQDVTRFKVGDPVFGYRGQNMGCYTEYLCMPGDGMLETKPANMPADEAATIPYGALTALNLLKKVNIQPGQKVLINGASGGIGSAALQLARHYGAEVTGVCSTARVEFVKALGADHVIDYTQEDFTQNDQTYDLIFDILGKLSLSKCRKSLTPNGRLLYASFKMKQLFQMLWTSIAGRSQKVICALSMEKPEDLTVIKGLVEEGAITTVIDKHYPLEQAAAAHRYYANGKKGHVVLTV